MATPKMGQFTYEMVLQFAKFQDALNKQTKATGDAGEKIRKQLEKVGDSITDKFKDVAAARRHRPVDRQAGRNGEGRHGAGGQDQ
jgi:hypothetical protein